MNKFRDFAIESIDDQLCFQCNVNRRSSSIEELLYIYVMYKGASVNESQFIICPREGTHYSQISLLFNVCRLSYKDENSSSLFDVFSSWHCEKKSTVMSWYINGPFVPANILAYDCCYPKEIFKIHQDEKIFPYDYSREIIRAIKESEMLRPYVLMIDDAYEKGLAQKEFGISQSFKLPQELFVENMFKINQHYYLDRQEFNLQR